MITMYHGSPERFDQFDLSKAGEGTGVKFDVAKGEIIAFIQ